MTDLATEQHIESELERQRQQPAPEFIQEEPATPTDGVEPIGWVMFFCLALVSLIGDGVEIFTAGTLGWFVGLLCDGILLVILGFTKSGKKQFRRVLVGLFGELIPIVNVLPLRTAFIIWAFIKSRSVTAQQIAHVTKL